MGDIVCRSSGKVDVEEEAAKEIRRKSEKKGVEKNDKRGSNQIIRPGDNRGSNRRD